MNNKIYVAPQTDVCMIEGQELLTSISSTNVDGLGVVENTSEHGVTSGSVKRDAYNVWDDDWSK